LKELIFSGRVIIEKICCYHHDVGCAPPKIIIYKKSHPEIKSIGEFPILGVQIWKKGRKLLFASIHHNPIPESIDNFTNFYYLLQIIRVAKI